MMVSSSDGVVKSFKYPKRFFNYFVTGPAKSGVTTLINGIASDGFNKIEEISGGVKKTLMSRGFEVHAQIFDNYSQVDNKRPTAHVVIVLTDVADAQHYAARIETLSNLINPFKSDNPKVVLVGTKCNLNRKVSNAELEELGKELKVDAVYKVSAGSNPFYLFQDTTDLLIDSLNPPPKSSGFAVGGRMSTVAALLLS